MVLLQLCLWEDLEDMTCAMLLEASKYMQALGNDGEMVFLAWTRRTVATCSTKAIYGPQIPLEKTLTLKMRSSRYCELRELVIPKITFS